MKEAQSHYKTIDERTPEDDCSKINGMYMVARDKCAH